MRIIKTKVLNLKTAFAHIVALGIIPLFVVAAFPITNRNYIFDRTAYFVNATVAILVGVATLVFFLGVIKYVIAKGDTEKLAEGRQYMVWGIIGLAVIASVWGLANLIVYTIFGTTGNFEIPIIGEFGFGGGGSGNAYNNAANTCPVCLVPDPTTGQPSAACQLCLDAASIGHLIDLFN